MKRKAMSLGFVVAVAMSAALISGGTAAAQFNTNYGTGALENNTSGNYNSAFGFDALHENTSGSQNTATGFNALRYSDRGWYNTAVGFRALYLNEDGQSNTASGWAGLYSNTTGDGNTADGYAALFYNSTGNFNTAIGLRALNANTSGGQNLASGYRALYSNSAGTRNTGEGANALYNNTTGNYNIALGFNAGVSLTTGNYNIDIGNAGAVGEANTIRIGVQGTQTGASIGGIAGSALTGSEVVVNANGRLGVVVSSARYKHDIRDMGKASSKLLKLRPVSFRYNNDPAGTLQYGLVAEEVEKVYPELVVDGADGKVETVRYSMLTSMLLNELQKQNRRNAQQAEQIKLLSARVEQVTRKLSALEQAMKAKSGHDVMARTDQ